MCGLCCFVRILDQFDGRAVLFDESHHHSRRGAVGWDDNVPVLNSFIHVIDLESDVREFLNDLRQRAALFVAHPLDAEFAGFVAAMVKLELGEVILAGHGLGSGDAEVVVSEAK